MVVTVYKVYYLIVVNTAKFILEEKKNSSMGIQKLLQKVLKRISPSKEERRKMREIAEKVLELVRNEMVKLGGEAILAGSFVRDTWLKGKKEFDVFMLFPESSSVEELREKGIEIGTTVVKKMGGSYRIEYAQHPYVRAEIEGINVDIVPCFKIKDTSKLKSAVDRTPFHVEYLGKKMKEHQRNDVRLLKQFLKANGLYGADSKTQGFSGFVCELLVIHYGSFLKVLENVKEWRPGEIIDIEGYYEDKKKVRKMFKNDILIIIDPTDRKRNAAAAVSAFNFFKFKKIAKDFLENPSEEWFFERRKKSMRKRELERILEQRGTNVIVIAFSPPRVVEDILWPQLRKFSERMKNILEERRYEFKVLGKGEYADEQLAAVLLEMEVWKLPNIQKRIGPKVFDLDDSRRFLKKYKEDAVAGPYVEKDRWVVEVERRFREAKQKIIHSLSVDEEILKAKGIPRYIANQIAKKFEVLEGMEIYKLVKKNKGFGAFLREYFEKERLV